MKKLAMVVAIVHTSVVRSFTGWHGVASTQRRHLITQAGPFKDINNMKKTTSLQGVSEFSPVVILVRTHLDQNVGAAARAMLNFGLGELRLVDPQCDWLSDDAKARASGGRLLLDAATVFSTVEEASSDLHATFATTARLRDVTMEVITPHEMAQRVVRLSSSEDFGSPDDSEVGGPKRCGLIFGPERSGLTNVDVESVNALVQIATNPNFASLNLAQAVNICAFQCYTHNLAVDEKMNAANTGGITGGFVMNSGSEDTPSSSSSSSKTNDVGAVLHVADDKGLATKGEVGTLMKRLEDSLDEAGFKQTDNGNAQAKIRMLVGRLVLSKREVSLMHGVVSALAGKGKFEKTE